VTDPARTPSRRPSSAPAPLVVAASLGALEGVLLVLLGLVELVALSGERLAMGLTTAGFFVVYGVGLGFCAWRVTRLEPWARSPLVLAQLIQLGVAWSFRGGSSTPAAVALALVAGIVLAGVFHPSSVEALRERD